MKKLLVTVVILMAMLAPAARAAATSTLPISFWGPVTLEKGQSLVGALNRIYQPTEVRFTFGGIGALGKDCDDLWDLDGINVAFVSDLPGGGLGQAPSNGLPLGANSHFCIEIWMGLLGGTPPPYPPNGDELVLAHEVGHTLGLGHEDGTARVRYLPSVEADPWKSARRPGLGLCGRPSRAFRALS